MADAGGFGRDVLGFFARVFCALGTAFLVGFLLGASCFY